MTSEWVYGFFTMGGYIPVEHPDKDERIVPRYLIDDGLLHDVIPDTIGQFTGLTDKNGKEIYEGDIISSKKHPQIKHLIFYNEKQGKFMAGLYGKTNIYDFGVCGVDFPAWMAEKEVIGNIHDNPNLIEKGGEK